MIVEEASPVVFVSPVLPDSDFTLLWKEALVGAAFAGWDQLGTLRDRGGLGRELQAPGIRELKLPPCRSVDRRDDAVVAVVRVWRSERLMDPKLGGNA